MEWKEIVGYEGYFVSDTGLVMGKRFKRPLKIAIVRYAYVCLTKNSVCKTFPVHHLVWDAFGDRPRNGAILQIDHIDGNRLNNKINNLQLLTNRENVKKYYGT